MELKEKIDHWKQLFKTKREEADKFYFDSMFEDIINRFLPKSKGLKKYRFLIRVFA